MLCHLSALSGYITGIGFIAGPLIVWLIKKDRYPLVDVNGKESLNFQISMLIYLAISAVLAFALIGIPLLVILGGLQLILPVVAGIKVNNGETFRYPMTIRLIN